MSELRSTELVQIYVSTDCRLLPAYCTYFQTNLEGLWGYTGYPGRADRLINEISLIFILLQLCQAEVWVMGNG